MIKHLAATLMMAASPALALDMTHLSDTERAIMGEEIRALLIEEPELIDRAMNPPIPDPTAFYIEEDQRRMAEQADRIAAQPGDMVIGPSGGPTITAFLGPDPQSIELAHTLRALLAETPEVSLTIKHWPAANTLAAIGQLHGPDAYWAAMDALAQNTPLETLAAQNGWPLPPITERAAQLDTDRSALAAALDLDRPPMLHINGLLVRGPVPEIAIRKYLSR
ncbi:hypothetical protein [Donghicola mangrovi]|uniref:Uncharacterized protein n=1 Tax=Donghicola mangrovi TaxID=2729614 RepID=A0A850QCE6_9RHOB|nr:hypothetical protein [Donghicola mangrovi]NVO23561.1 hypothetical protein [Donghicola mangrovi]